MKNLDRDSIEYTLLCIQGGLFDAVTPDLRAVVFDLYEDRKRLFLRFYYDGDVSEEDIEGWNCSITEASSGMGIRSDNEQIERLDFPKPIPFLGPNEGGGYLAFLRLEPGSAELDPARIVHLNPMEEDDPYPEAYALLAASNALLGKISPELRAVIVEVPPGTTLFNIHFIYDGESLSEKIRLWESVGLEICSRMDPKYTCDIKITRIDFPQKISGPGRCAYFRKEPQL